jgi:hypothetical protein
VSRPSCVHHPPPRVSFGQAVTRRSVKPYVGYSSFEEPDGGATPDGSGGSFTSLAEGKSVDGAVQKFEDLINSRHAPGRRVCRL